MTPDVFREHMKLMVDEAMALTSEGGHFLVAFTRLYLDWHDWQVRETKP